MISYPTNDPVRLSRVTIPALAGYGLALATVPLSWWVLGPLDTGPDHDSGPFRLPLAFLYSLGVLSAVVAALSLGAIAVASRTAQVRGVAGLSVTTTVFLLATGSLIAAGGRVLTAGGDGANIGGDFVLLAGPGILAGLLVAAVFVQSAYRHIAPRRTSALVVLASAVAPALWVGLFALA